MIRVIILIVAMIIPLHTNAIEYPVVGKFENFNEVFIGIVNTNLNGKGKIWIKGDNSGVVCQGNSEVTYYPFISFLLPVCEGQKGKATLKCGDGRSVYANWTAKSCTTGYGYGRDSGGAKFQFAFGMSQAEAAQKLSLFRQQVASKPDLPIYKPKETRKKEGFNVGTGFFVSKNGHFLTNFHVIEDATKVSVKYNNKLYEAKILYSDAVNDIALGKIEAETDKLELISSVESRAGENVYTQGFPMPHIQGQELKATFGRINAVSGIDDDVRYFQVDVPIQPGNSGGPLCDKNGQVIGITTMTLNALTSLKTSGHVPQSVNYALKSDYALLLLNKIDEEFDSPDWNWGFKPEVSDSVEDTKNSVILIIAE